MPSYERSGIQVFSWLAMWYRLSILILCYVISYWLVMLVPCIFFLVAVRTTWYLIPRIVQSAGVVRSVMTYGVFVELELKGGSTLWGFIAPEKLKRQHQSWRGEEGNLKAYVKKDALKLAQELKVRVLPTSAMSHFACISASGKCLRIGHGDFNRKKYDSDHGISSCAILRQTLHFKGVL